jgi:hypothetical protein
MSADEAEEGTFAPVGSIDLNFRGSSTLNGLKATHELGEMRLVSISISSKSHLLAACVETVPEPLHQGIAYFPASRADTRIALIVADVDWTSGDVTESRVVRLDVLGPAVHYADETSDGFVLMSARCDFGEHNVVVASADGSVIREACYGDGISHIACFNDKVTVGYFGEGVFGNSRWKSPIGSPGIVQFDLEGNILWQNSEHEIYDVYAMTFDDSGRVWFHNYCAFEVVCCSHEAGSVSCDPGIGRSNHLFVSQNAEWVMLDGGYPAHVQLYAFRFDNPSEKWRAWPKIDGQEAKGTIFGRGSRMVLAGEGSRLSFFNWDAP